jgi:hypothetical protein
MGCRFISIIAAQSTSMVSNIFSYKSNKPATGSSNLLIECGPTHLAFLSFSNDGFDALDWFKWDATDKNDTPGLLEQVRSKSAMSSAAYDNTIVYINNNSNIWIPASLFRQQETTDYLSAIHGPSPDDNYQFDVLQQAGGLVNAYRLPHDLLRQLEAHFTVAKVQHAHTRLLSKCFEIKHLPAYFLQVLFYESTFILTAFVDGRFILMRSFNYQAPDDAVYHLTNTCRQLGIDMGEAVVKVSGFIDAHSVLYTYLNRCFTNISLETVAAGRVHFEMSDPLHYFTPLFNLAL